jgi:hypothetical protein
MGAHLAADQAADVLNELVSRGSVAVSESPRTWADTDVLLSQS